MGICVKFLILVVSFTVSSFAQFGQNKVQYANKEWVTIKSAHFDIYYNGGYKGHAEYAASFLEKALDSISRSIDYNIKKRIPVVVYGSHSDFSQTNIIMETIGEGIGGFTEVYKSRVVVPFTGSWPDFRHVLHHELTHAVMYDLIFENVINAFRARTSFQIPLWVAEGWAEYESAKWNFESDMYLMDALLYGYIAGPEYEFGSQFLAYKAGNAFFNFMAAQYGHESIGRFLKNLALLKNTERAFRRATREDLKVASDHFINELKRRYWPELGKRATATQFAKRLTRHRVIGNSFLSSDRGADPLAYFNIQPSVSPDGRTVAYFSDREDYPAVFLMDASNGKLIKKIVAAGTSDNFESFHSFKSGIAWSPDGNAVCVVAQSGGRDVLKIISISSGKVNKQLPFEFDRIEHPDWSKDGESIVFSALSNGRSDLYIVSLSTGSVKRLTNDENYDTYPRFSPDGKKVLFESETSGERIYGGNGTNLFLLDLEANRIKRLTDTPFEDKMATFADSGRSVVFVSNRSGIDNMYKLDMDSLSVMPLTNTYSGCFNPSFPDDSRFMVFALFENGGWDIYRVDAPFSTIKDSALPPTEYASSFSDSVGSVWKKINLPQSFDSDKVDSIEAREERERQPPSINYDPFSPYSMREESRRINEKRRLVVDTSDFLHDSLLYKNRDGSFREMPYTPKFSFDAISAAVGGAYSPYGASIAGQTAFMLSDILGNHRIYLAANLYNSGLEDPLNALNGYVRYDYLKLRTDIAGAFSRFTNVIYWQAGDTSIFYFDAVNELRLEASYPFSKYTRVDGALGGTLLTRDKYALLAMPDGSYVEMPRLQLPSSSYFDFSGSLVFDNTMWGNTGPVRGTRVNLSALISPRVGGTEYGFGVAVFDFRQYIRFLRKYTVAMRINGGSSVAIGNGINPKKFYLGGTPNNLAYFFSPFGLDGSIESNYFSSVIMPLRGYAIAGVNPSGNTQFGLANLEFRFPFIDYLILHVPPIGFRSIAATAFIDAGTAWDNRNEVSLFRNGSLDDLRMGSGFGLRAHLLYGILFKWDRAWRIGKDHGREDYISVGAEF